MSTFNKVKEVIIDKLGVEEDTIKTEAHFVNDLGADSLDTVELIMEFEEEFGIKNPLNPSDSSPMNHDQKCPSIMTGVDANLGRIHFARDDSDTEIWICTRYGTGTNDVWKATIDNPY